MNIAGQSALEATAGYWNTAAAAIEQHAFIGGRGGVATESSRGSPGIMKGSTFDTIHCAVMLRKRN